MRTVLPAVLLMAVLAAPAQAQTCKKVPPPFLPGLFPERAAGMEVQFATDPTGGCTAMYRPASAAARAERPWAMVNIEANTDGALGEEPDSVLRRFTAPTYALYTMAGWPVVMRQAPLGDEFVAVRGSVRVLVLVKNGDHGEVSRALAAAVMEQILPKVPCG